MITAGDEFLTRECEVYPGTFDPVTPGHLDIMERVRHLFTRITVLVAVNSDKEPAGDVSERAAQVRRELPASSTLMRGLGGRDQTGGQP